MSSDEIYAILCAKSDEMKLPEFFENDLHRHDKRRLDREGLQEFVWIVRTNGTHMYTGEELKRNPGLLSPGVISDRVVVWFEFKDGALTPRLRDYIRDKYVFGLIK